MSVLVLGLMVSPMYIFAADVKTKMPKEEKVKNGFCDKIDTVTEKFINKIDEKTENVANRKQNRVNELTQKWLARDDARSENQNEQDAKIQSRFDALMAKADTDAKKEAVKKFQEAVNSAVSTRRNSVNTAVSTFRNGVKELVGNKFSEIDNKVVVLKNAIDEAVATAKNSCANGVSGNVVRSTFISSIKSAFDTFKQDRTDLIIRDDIIKLSEARKASIDQAISKFKSDMEKAKADLKLVFNG